MAEDPVRTADNAWRCKYILSINERDYASGLSKTRILFTAQTCCVKYEQRFEFNGSSFLPV